MRRAPIVLAWLFCAAMCLPQEHGGEKQAEHATEGGHGGKAEPSILWKWANFAMLAGGLGYMIGKAGPAFFRGRTAEIQKGIVEAARQKKDAEARAAETDRKLATLQAEIDDLRRTAKQEVAAEGERVRKDTEQQLAKIREHRDQEIASATKHAKQELKAYSAQLAIQLAEQKIRGELTPPKETELIDGFLKGLK